MSFHSITVIGHAGSEPTHQVTATGKDYSYFPLYVNEQVGDSERTTRYKVKTWHGLSLVVRDYLHTGQMVVVEGIPSVEAWRDAAGEPRAQLVVTARRLRFLGARPEVPAETGATGAMGDEVAGREHNMGRGQRDFGHG